MQDLHAQLPQLPPQHIHNVKRPVGDREDAVAPLCFQRAAAGFEKLHRIFRREAVQRAHQKAAAPGNLLQRLLRRAVICHITAALAGDPQLFAQPLIGLQQRHTQAARRGSDGGKHPRRTAADDRAVKPRRLAFH